MKNSDLPIDRRLVFAVSPSDVRGVATLLVGVPAGAWDHVKDGKTAGFDLSRIGIPFQLIMFGAETHDAAMKMLEQFASASGVALLDERRRDFAPPGMETPGMTPKPGG